MSVMYGPYGVTNFVLSVTVWHHVASKVLSNSQSELTRPNQNQAWDECMGNFGIELGHVRTSNFSLAKINCHRNYGKVFAFTNSKEKC